MFARIRRFRPRPHHYLRCVSDWNVLRDRELRSAEERGVTGVQDIRARLKKKHQAQRAALEQQIRDADARLSHVLMAPPGARGDGRPDVDAQAGVELLDVVLSQHQQKVRATQADRCRDMGSVFAH